MKIMCLLASYKKKIFENLIFFGILKVTEEWSRIWIH